MYKKAHKFFQHNYDLAVVAERFCRVYKIYQFEYLVDKPMMNALMTIFILFFAVSCGQLARKPAAETYLPSKHIVFDIDWTITSEVAPDFKGERIIEVEGKKYFVHDGIEDFVENILSKKDISISFFSGGSLTRNQSLLKQIKLRDGRSLYEIAYKILSKEDLTTVPNALATDKFSKRYKKDLLKVSRDLSQLIMIDDTEHFVLNALQEEHVIPTGKTFEHFEKFSEAKVATGDYIPRSESEWSFARKKLLILNGAFEQAYNDLRKKGLSFKEAMKNQEQLLDLASGEWSEYSTQMLKLSAVQKSRLMASSQYNCFQLIKPLMELP